MKSTTEMPISGNSFETVGEFSATQKAELRARLKKIGGLVSDVQRMLVVGQSCTDITALAAEVVASLQKVEQIVMQHHLTTCVADAFGAEDPLDQKEKIGELMSFLNKTRNRG